MRASACSVLFLLTLASACSYPCEMRCLAVADTLAQQGHNPDSEFGSGGMDPDTVCDAEEIQQARTCEECDAAFRERFRIIFHEVACDCPPLTAAWGDEARTVYYYDEQCQWTEAAYDVEGCAAYAAGKSYEECVEVNQSYDDDEPAPEPEPEPSPS